MIEFFRTIANTVGIIGVTLILTGYFLINTNRVTSKNLGYLSLNFCGAWLILFSLLFHWNLASVLIELAWIVISVVGFYRLLRF
jgi:nitrate reductase gamma subunit